MGDRCLPADSRHGSSHPPKIESPESYVAALSNVDSYSSTALHLKSFQAQDTVAGPVVIVNNM